MNACVTCAHDVAFGNAQEWERFVKSIASGVKTVELRKAILSRFRELSDVEDGVVFQEKSAQFNKEFVALASVVEGYEDWWEDIADHWAAFGRKAVSKLHRTNNIVNTSSVTSNTTFAAGREPGASQIC
jgi:hypothetical protein